MGRWYQCGARYLAVGLMVATVGACASQHPAETPSSSASGTAEPGTVTPANIKRIRSALPDGYEVADMPGPISIAGLWGFGSGWLAEPAQCAALADPAPLDGGGRGISASGPGGTVYVIVSATGQVGPPEAALIDGCREWTMSFRHTSGVVKLVDAPRIEGTATLAMAMTARTAVESGMETDAQISASSAYLDGHVATVTLITDPGSRHAPLGPEFVADLLPKTVIALRG